MMVALELNFVSETCTYCFSENENSQVELSVRRKDKNETLLVDFSHKIRQFPEALAIPETVLMLEDTRFTDELRLALKNAGIIKHWVKKANYLGTPLVMFGLTDEFFNSLHDGQKSMSYFEVARAAF